ASDDLLAQELRPKCADAEYVGDRVGVPAFGEHCDRDDAANLFAEPAALSDGVHDFAKEVFVRDVVGGAPVTSSADDLLTKTPDLIGGHVAEVLVERFVALELRAVDEERVRPREWVAVLVEVPEQLQPAVMKRRRPVLVLDREA